MTRPRLIETFNTHRMTAAVIQAVKTARDLELDEAMQAVRQAASQPQQTAQHLIVYGERGSGKSFLMRLVEIETERLAREEGLAVMAALLPEEQYNIRSAPQLIQAIAAKVRGAGWEAVAFAMDFRPLADAWDAAVADLNAALDQRFGQGLGLVVAMVENFDTLTRSLFGAGPAAQKKTASARTIEQNAAEQLLRKLMNTQGSRLMLIASATGTVDQDYERPLFQAFKTLDLRIWTSDDCIAYFNRRRALENQAALSPPEAARARAVAEFIGGNPRLAQLLGEVLASPDARSVAATLDALSDHLADYYRHRLDDLPPQSAALLDALIRKGEPCTQTELAARVGASSQAQIADAFSYLLSSRLLAAGPDKQGAGRLYRVRDRLFVHFYRRRYGNPEQALGLAPIAELLESFFTQREREEHTRRHLEAGEWADARLYALNSPFLSLPTDGFCEYRDGALIGTPLEFFKFVGLDVIEASEAQLELKLYPDKAVKRWRDTAIVASFGLSRTAALILEAIALSRCQLDNEAETTLAEALQMAETNEDKDSQILALCEMVFFEMYRRKNKARFLELSDRVGSLVGQAKNECLQAEALCIKAWNFRETGRIQEAIILSDEASELAVSIGSSRMQAYALRFKACSLYKIERYDEAALTAKKAADLAVATGAVHSQIEALGILGDVLFKLDKHKIAESIYGKAVKLAIDIGNDREQSRLLCRQSESLCQHNYAKQALSAACKAATLAEKLGDSDLQAQATLCEGNALNHIGKHTEATAAFEKAAQLASRAGDVDLQLKSLNARILTFKILNKLESAIELAQVASEIAAQSGNVLVQVRVLSFKGCDLAKLGRTDEALNTISEAFGVAKSSELKQQLVIILNTQHLLFGNRDPKQTLALAREAIAETQNTTFVNDLWKALWIFFDVLTHAQAPDMLEVFETLLAEITGEESAQPLINILKTVLAAVAYNNLWDEFTACLSRHPQALPLLKSPNAFDEIGRVWSEHVKANGRAQTYAAIARQLPAIVRATEWLPCASVEVDTLPELDEVSPSMALDSGIPAGITGFSGERRVVAEENSHLRGLINGLVNHCDDAGFLQDMAELLKEGFGEKAEAEIQRLKAFAEVHAALDKEKVLQRLDPDLALAIRRILGLPEPDDLLAQKGRRKGR